MRFTLILATISTEPAAKPETCPHCQSGHVGHWQTVPRTLRDTQVATIAVERWYCRACRATFGTAPEGITKAAISRRLKSVAVALYLLGLSYRAVTDFLKALGHPLSHVTVYQAVQAAAAKIPDLKQQAVFSGTKTVALGADVTSVQVKGQWCALGVTVDDLTGVVLTVDVLTGQTGEALYAWLAPIAEAVGAEIVVTDDADALKQAVNKLALPQQVCKAHVQRTTDALVDDLLPQAKQDADRLWGAP